jgi:phosphoribosylformimino-5-aminoimidazole carboxamide ribotide isomerase
MIIIPAVDIKNGKCVRLLQGRQDAETVFSDDPAAMARKWASAGAELIHVIDLDGAFTKSPRNLDAIKQILKTVDTPMQLGGGIRDEQTAKTYLDLGVDKIIIGTEAIRHPDWVERIAEYYPGRVVVGIDARNGKVAIEGWTENTQIDAIDLARRFENCGIGHINFTDITGTACRPDRITKKPAGWPNPSTSRSWPPGAWRQSRIFATCCRSKVVELSVSLPVKHCTAAPWILKNLLH